MSMMAVAMALVASVGAPGSLGAAQEVQTTPGPDVSVQPDTVEPSTIDPDAPAVLPPLATSEPLRSGLTPQIVADTVVPGPRPTAPTLTATGAVLFDPADGVILAGLDERVGRPMASTTKIMTVLLALEVLQSGSVAPDVTVSANAAATGQLPGVATLGLREGDVVPLRDLLAADLLQSGNDGAVAIAEHISGSETAFVAQMNQRVATLGLEDTGFVDSSGLSNDPAHRASPLDLALLGQEAMSHPDFAAWAGSATLDVPPFGVLDNRNELLQVYEGTTGIKTGFTNLAGLTLVASAQRDGRTLYAVVLGSEDRVGDTIALFDHGFGEYGRPVAGRPRGARCGVPLSRWRDTAVRGGGTVPHTRKRCGRRDRRAPWPPMPLPPSRSVHPWVRSPSWWTGSRSSNCPCWPTRRSPDPPPTPSVRPWPMPSARSPDCRNDGLRSLPPPHRLLHPCTTCPRGKSCDCERRSG